MLSQKNKAPTPSAPSGMPAMKSEKGMGSLNMVANTVNEGHAAYFAAITDSPLSHAFTRKTAIHAGASGPPVAEKDVPAQLERLHETPRSGPAATYVHLPYCESKCLYCGFFGGKYTKAGGATYLESLIKEIESEQKYCSTTSSPINALYLGGGTPTALEPQELSLLLRTLRQVLPLANDCEITVEGRIHNFGPEKIEACLEAGANRFSLGVQTFNTNIRRSLGRIAPKEEVIKHLKTLAAYNQAAIIVDLIYGLPGQTLTNWEEDIRTFLDLPLDGVDLYQLNIFPGSSLAKAVESGKVPPAATLAEQGVFFERGVNLMQSARSRRLSMSHWGRTSRERNLYNPLAKSKADCLHFGAGAGGLLQGYFMFNKSNADEYMQRCSGGEKPIAMMATPAPDLPVVRSILEQMELCRLNLDALGTAFAALPHSTNTDAYTLYAPLLDNWEKAGLITQDGSWIELTLAGQFWQVNLTQALIGWQRQMSKE